MISSMATSISFIWLFPWTALVWAVAAKTVGFIGVDRVLPGLGGDLVDGSRQLFNRAGLLRRSLGKGLAAFGNLTGTGSHLVGGIVEIGQDMIEAGNDQVQRLFD